MSRKEEFVAWLHVANGKAKKLGIASPRFIGMLADVDAGKRDAVEMAISLIWSEKPKQGFLRAKETDKSLSIEWGALHEFPDLFDEDTKRQARERLED